MVLAGSLTLCSGDFCYVLASINVLFVALTIPENIIVLVSLGRLNREKRWKIPNILMASLATTDLLSGCISQSLYAYFLFRQGNALSEDDIKGCDFWLLLVLNYSSYTLCGASLLIVAVMSIDRLLAVSRPIPYKANVFRHRICIVLFCVTSFCIFIPILRFASADTVPIFTYVISSIIAMSLIATIGSYVMVICIFRKASGRRFSQSNVTVTSATTGLPESTTTAYLTTTSDHDRKLTTSFAIIAVTLISMYLPQLILKPLTLSKSNGLHRIPVSLEDIANTLLYCNSFINPIIYSFRHKGIQKEIKAMFGCTRNRSNSNTVMNVRTSLNGDAKKYRSSNSSSCATDQSPTGSSSSSPKASTNTPV
eukprot:gene16876-18581_t